ncbi:MAG: hypothetical protein AAF645_18325, partial [Myxococcota bacterium]
MGRNLASDQTGLSTVEYIIILFLVAILGVAAWQLFGTSISDGAEEGAEVFAGLSGRSSEGGGEGGGSMPPGSLPAGEGGGSSAMGGSGGAGSAGG